MALISAGTLIRSISIFHLTLAFYFLTAPKIITEQTLVYILGEAMKLPAEPTLESTSPPLAFLSALLIFLSISDLTSVSMPEEFALYHWGSQAPIRLLVTFSLSAYSFLFSRNSPYMRGSIKGYSASTWGLEGLKNRVFFSWAFVEMMIWFWIWATLREERGALATKQALARKQREELEDNTL